MKSNTCPDCGKYIPGQGKPVCTCFCSKPGCGYPDGKPCIGCGRIVQPKLGRPPIAGEPAKGQIQLRVTMARKNAYVRAAKPKKLTEWIFQYLDKAADYKDESV